MKGLHDDQSALLRLLTLRTIKRQGDDALLLDENDRLRDGRLARLGSVVLVEAPADGRLPKRVECYSVSDGEAAFKLDPARLLYRLEYSGPKDVHLPGAGPEAVVRRRLSGAAPQPETSRQGH